MIYKNLLKVALVFLICSFIFSPFLVGAKSLEIDYPELMGNTPAPASTKTFLPDYIQYLFSLMLKISAVVVFLSLVYGGFLYITSVGNPGKMGEANQQMLNSVYGLIIILASYLLLNTINPELVFLKGPQIDSTSMGIRVFDSPGCEGSGVGDYNYRQFYSDVTFGPAICTDDCEEGQKSQTAYWKNHIKSVRFLNSPEELVVKFFPESTTGQIEKFEKVGIENKNPEKNMLSGLSSILNNLKNSMFMAKISSFALGEKVGANSLAITDETDYSPGWVERQIEADQRAKSVDTGFMNLEFEQAMIEDNLSDTDVQRIRADIQDYVKTGAGDIEQIRKDISRSASGIGSGATESGNVFAPPFTQGECQNLSFDNLQKIQFAYKLPGVYLFKDTKCEGDFIYYNTSTSTFPTAPEDWINKIACVKIVNKKDSNFVAVLHEHTGFKGRCQEFIGKTPPIDNPEVEAADIFGPETGGYIYIAGVDSLTVFEIPTKKKNDGSDQGVSLYDEANYQTSILKLLGSYDNQKESAAYYTFDTGALTYYNCGKDGNCSTTALTGLDGSLECNSTCVGVSDLRYLDSFKESNDRITSLKVTPTYTAILWEGLDYEGVCEVFNSNVADLHSYDLGNCFNWVGFGSSDCTSSLKVFQKK